MKKIKMMLLSLPLAISPVIALTACNKEVKNENFKENIDLKLNQMRTTLNQVKDIKQLNSLYDALDKQIKALVEKANQIENITSDFYQTVSTAQDNQFRQITYEVSKLAKNSSEADPNSAAELDKTKKLLDKMKSDYDKSIKELQKMLDEAKAKMSADELPRNDISAKEALNTIFNFIEVEFHDAWKKQQPDKYKENHTFWESMIKGVLESKELINKEPEDFTNVKYFERLVLHFIDKLAVLQDYLEGEKKVELVHAKEKFMTALFEWRVNDITKAINAISKQKTTENPKKDEHIKILNDAKTEYEVIMKQSVDFPSQTFKFKYLEENIIYKLLLDPNKYHTYRGEYKLTFESNEFPVYKQINNKKLLDELNILTSKIYDEYSAFFGTKAQYFLTSVYFTKKLYIFKENIQFLKNVRYTSEANTKKEVLYYIEKARSILFDLEKVDYIKLRDEYKTKNASLLSATEANSVRKFVNSNITPKKDENKNYELFELWAKKELTKLDRLKEDSFVNAFHKHVAIKKIETHIKTIYDYMNYWTTLKEDPNSPELKSLLSYDKDLSKYDKSIADENKIIDEYKTNNTFLSVELKKVVEIMPSTQDEVNLKKYFVDSLNKATTFKTLIEKEVAEAGKFENYADDFKTLLINSINLYVNEVIKLNSEAKDKSIEQLKNMASILQTKFVELNKKVGHENEGKKTLLFERLNDNAFQEGYNETDETYTKISKLVIELQKVIEATKSNLFSTKDEAKTFIEKQDLIFKKFETDVIAAKTAEVFTGIGDTNEFTNNFDKLLNEYKVVWNTLVAQKDAELAVINPLLILLNNKSKEQLETFGFDDTGFNKSSKGKILTYIEDSNNNISGYQRKKTQIEKLTKIVPGQELYALIRLWVKNESAQLSARLISDKHDDKETYKLLTGAFEAIRSKNQLFRNLNDIQPSFISFTDPKNDGKQGEVIAKIKELELAYAQASLNALKVFKDQSSTQELKTSAKEALTTSRKAYYDYLNSSDFSIERNSEIRQLASKYTNYEDYNNQGFQPFHIAYLYGELVSLTDTMNWLYDSYIKE
ncbi:hypothetical protein [Mycoplasma crocodyli]|uniref:Putative lipoprotein n=1 Tax=Mycoplasma crocodyli (strain ATCC 51981 / MP145) TaxID=512564 RepID=D5E5R9_MYCCM|nr:hypothetical protein [Mycoplasma crocodyli]ADE19406.1 putative lipoprotein [Mycoplasma crocodyli MP145]